MEPSKTDLCDGNVKVLKEEFSRKSTMEIGN
jgi:hypothetical protein